MDEYDVILGIVPLLLGKGAVFNQITEPIGLFVGASFALLAILYAMFINPPRNPR